MEYLKHQNFKHLTEEQVDSFMTHGFLRIPKAFTPKAAEQWSKDVWIRLDVDPNDKSTYKQERTNMPSHRHITVKDISPAAWNSICELCGGEDRITEGSKSWSDGFIVNLGTEQWEGKEDDPYTMDGWHVDGDFFVHFLDSPEQALLVIPCWTDVKHNGGATWINENGPKVIGQHLFEHPEGVLPRMQPRGVECNNLDHFNATSHSQPRDSFHEMTGEIGDVVLMHPLMLHSASHNGRRLPRVITNPPVGLNEPFNFDRANPAEYSLVELKTMKEVGVEKLKGWKITAPRDRVIPDRLKVQNPMVTAERERMQKAGIQIEVKEISQVPA